MTRTFVFSLVLVVGGFGVGACGEGPESDVQPVQITGSGARRVDRQRDPAIVQPHLNRREVTAEERARRDRELEAVASGGGGGGGFGSRPEDWVPRPSSRPSDREVQAFRRGLERGMANVDPSDDVCAQFEDVAAAGHEAGERPADPESGLPGRAAMRRMCRRSPEAWRECMDQTYFRAHTTECNAVMGRMARDGERRRARAEEEWRQVRGGEHPLQHGARPPRTPTDTDADDTVRDDEADFEAEDRELEADG